MSREWRLSVELLPCSRVAIRSALLCACPLHQALREDSERHLPVGASMLGRPSSPRIPTATVPLRHSQHIHAFVHGLHSVIRFGLHLLMHSLTRLGYPFLPSFLVALQCEIHKRCGPPSRGWYRRPSRQVHSHRSRC